MNEQAVPTTIEQEPIFSVKFISTIMDEAEATLANWLKANSATKAVNDLLSNLTYMNILLTEGREGYIGIRPGEYDLELAATMAILVKAIGGVEATRKPAQWIMTKVLGEQGWHKPCPN